MGADQSNLGTSSSGTTTSNYVSFFLNDQLHEVYTSNGKFRPDSKLVDFIRDEAGLKGTKYMCREGGCGACVVTVKYREPSTGQNVIKAVNSCLIPIFSCDGWTISTIESLGDRQKGYSEIQQKLVAFGGTQCGFCTPGMVMNMHSLLERKKVVKTKDIEDLLDGNICRCTGYRPILDAFKSLAEDASQELLEKCTISSSSAATYSPCRKNQEGEEEFEVIHKDSSNIWLKFKSGEQWVTATTLASVFEAIQRFQAGGIKYKIVAGNTGTGIFKNDGPFEGYIDITKVPELAVETVVTDGISLGSTLSLYQTIEFFQRASEMDGFKYLLQLRKHILRVANVPVRNVGTLGGNLMLKHNHPEFPSDIFLLLTTVGASILIASGPTTLKTVNMTEFLSTNMENQLILSINLPRYDSTFVFRSFKITRRYQNSHADVNAGFLLNISQPDYTVVGKPTIIFGGINPNFVHASATEEFLSGKSLKDLTTLQGALKALETEIQPNYVPPDASVEYRKGLTQSLLYKVILKILSSVVQKKFVSGGKGIRRGKTSGKQIYDTDKSVWPLNKPMPKLEAVAQCSGEAEYLNDIPARRDELFGAFVLSSVAKAQLDSIDASEALKLKGVHKFIEAKDIPGINNYMVLQDPEEIFASKDIMFAGQSLGMIFAESRDLAFEALKLVQVKYKNVSKPLLEGYERLEKENTGAGTGIGRNGINTVRTKMDSWEERDVKLFHIVRGPEGPCLENANGTTSVVVKGEFKFGGQYHFHMETQSCLCIPKEDSIQIYSATQWMDHVQASVASALGISNNQVSIEVKRIGGAYGSKITRATLIACACAIGAKILNKPVRVVLDLQTNMELIGKRSPYIAKYEVEVNSTTGKILKLNASIFAEVGSVINDADISDAAKFMQNCYDATGWTITPSQVLTDKAPNTYCRAPGTSQGIAMIEHIMEHIAFEIGQDPIELRKVNFIKDGSVLLVPNSLNTKFLGDNLLLIMIERMKKSADLDRRKQFVTNFNKLNRWRKRGIAIVPLKYDLEFNGTRYPVYVAIYKNDGTVVVTHGGIEVGQGINTKVAQTVGYMFQIPVSKIRVTASNNVLGANGDSTGGSITSELCCYAASVACQTLIDRMKPVKNRLKNPTWEQLITACGKLTIDLTASHMYCADDPVMPYNIWGLTATEVEIDCLTGEYKIIRVDIVEDAGRSLNPEVDVGQVEGAFVMAIGWWTTENLVYDPLGGKLLTNNTWVYKPPTAADIPTDFRVTLLRKAPNPLGVLRSKATGEPPLCMGVCVLFALRNAIFEARRDAGNNNYVSIDGPLTQEKIKLHCLTEPSQFLL